MKKLYKLRLICTLFQLLQIKKKLKYQPKFKTALVSTKCSNHSPFMLAIVDEMCNSTCHCYTLIFTIVNSPDVIVRSNKIHINFRIQRMFTWCVVMLVVLCVLHPFLYPGCFEDCKLVLSR